MFKNLRFFNKKEITIIIAILGFIFLLSLKGFSDSFKRERDMDRKHHLSQIAIGLNRYAGDYGSYPLSSDGKILGCEGPNTTAKKVVTEEAERKKLLLENLVVCEWGKSALIDITDPNYPRYIDPMPIDPQSDKGLTYVYFSNGKEFQIFSFLELKEEEYDKNARNRKILCGKRYCNFGKASPETPLEKTIE